MELKKDEKSKDQNTTIKLREYPGASSIHIYLKTQTYTFCGWYVNITHKNIEENIEEKIKTINAQLENYCQQQNLEIINNSNIKKSKLNSSFHSSLNTSLHPFTQVFETGMSNRHLIYTMFKSTYTKLEPKLF